MRTKSILAMAVVIVGSLLMAQQPVRVSRADDTFTCDIPNFGAVVLEGPDKDFGIIGDLKLQVAASGSFTGTLTDSNTSNVMAVVGQVNGHAINLAVDMGKSKDFPELELYIFGSGTLINDIKQCKGDLGGVLVGPLTGDLGDWGLDICKHIHPGQQVPPICVNPLPTKTK